MDEVSNVGFAGTQPVAEPTAVQSTSTEQTQDTNAVTGENQPNAQGEDSTGNEQGLNSEKGSRSVPYERFQEVNNQVKELREQQKILEQRSQAFEKFEKAFSAESEAEQIDPVIAEADQQIRRLGYVKADELERLLDERDQKRAEENENKQREDSLLNQFTQLGQKYNGQDGMPKFNAEEVANFMDSRGVLFNDKGEFDVEAVFKAMHPDEFADALAKQKKGSTFSERSGGVQNSLGDTQEVDFDKVRRTGSFGDLINNVMGPIAGQGKNV